MRYDPHQHIASEAWQALDESERIESVRQYHRRNRIRLPNERLHAIIHVIVENQVALGDTFLGNRSVPRLAQQLRGGQAGPMRHDRAIQVVQHRTFL